MTFLLIGYNDGVLNALDGLWPHRSVSVVEEPDLWHGKQLAAKAARHPVFAEVRFGRYQQDEQFLDVVAATPGITGVAAGLEYAVEAAALAAETLGLPGAGAKAAAVLRDKLLLRQTTTAAGMPGPQFREVRSAAEVARFAADRHCVLKPAGRQASLGVVMIELGADIERAWQECTGADEGHQVANRPMRWRYLVEERLHGPEFSTECLVDAGRLRFLNVTAKRTAPGPYPVELGHVVPGDRADRWRPAVDHLVQAVGFGTGILHAEWVLTTDGPVLIECAGRPPGDRIMDLIDLAYQVNLTDLWLRLLTGAPVNPPAAPVGGAAVRFLTAEPGTITRIDGVDLARQRPGVCHVDVTRRPGDRIGDLKSSWDRVGSVIAVGEKAARAEENACSAASDISVR